MTLEETEIALFETRLTLHRLVQSLKGVELEQHQQFRIKHAEYILKRHGQITDVLRKDTIKTMG